MISEIAAIAATWVVMSLALLGTLVVLHRQYRRRGERAAGLPTGFLTWDYRKQLAYLRHPGHSPRCACGRYGAAYAPVLEPDGVLHAPDECGGR